jgi:hypothetical protein
MTLYPANDWYFSVNGYMEPYFEEAEWVNDWLQGSITLVADGHTKTFVLQHLLVEELENFQRWLTELSNGISVSSSFGFTDGDLWFNVLYDNGISVLRVEHGYETGNQVCIETKINTQVDFLSVQISRINALLNRYPSRLAINKHSFRQ